MPRNTREWALRKLDMVKGNFETSQRHMLEVIDKYIEVHPEVAAPLDALVKAVDALKENVQIIRDNI